MSICNPCTRLQPISLCTDELIIGTVTTANPRTVYFRSLANGSTFSYPATSTLVGSVYSLKLTLPDGFPLATGMLYEMWVNETGQPIENRNALTIGTTEAECFNVSAITVYDLYYGDYANFSTQTLTVS